jgi:hypothetical protein
MMPAEGFNDKSTNCRPWNINQIPIGAGADCTSVVELCDGDMLFLNLSSARQVVPEFSYTRGLNCVGCRQMPYIDMNNKTCKKQKKS